MELSNFISDFEQQFEKIDPGTIQPDTDFKNVRGWDSLTAMLVIDMVSSNYGKTIVAEDFRQCTTIEDLFNRIRESK